MLDTPLSIRSGGALMSLVSKVILLSVPPGCRLSAATSEEQLKNGVSMSLISRWQHEDGSVVEFSTAGWKSDDPAKTRWLNQMSALTSSGPVISPLIRMWLQAYCEAIELRGQPEVFSSASDQNVSQTGVEDEAFRAVGDGQLDGAGEEVKRRMRITIRSIANACDEFFRSRGMSTKVSGSVWQRDKRATQPRPSH